MLMLVLVGHRAILLVGVCAILGRCEPAVFLSWLSLRGCLCGAVSAGLSLRGYPCRPVAA